VLAVVGQEALVEQRQRVTLPVVLVSLIITEMALREPQWVLITLEEAVAVAAITPQEEQQLMVVALLEYKAEQWMELLMVQPVLPFLEAVAVAARILALEPQIRVVLVAMVVRV
jgi:hypothetical protein